MRTRCYGCCQENCGYEGCTCSCHFEHGAAARESEVAFRFYAVAENLNYRATRWYQTYAARRTSGWVDAIEDAKVWTKRGPAQSRCTQLGGTASLVEFVVSQVNVIDQADHRRKFQEKRLRKEEEKRLLRATRELEDAELTLRVAQENVVRLKKG